MAQAVAGLQEMPPAPKDLGEARRMPGLPAAGLPFAAAFGYL